MLRADDSQGSVASNSSQLNSIPGSFKTRSREEKGRREGEIQVRAVMSSHNQ